MLARWSAQALWFSAGLGATAFAALWILDEPREADDPDSGDEAATASERAAA